MPKPLSPYRRHVVRWQDCKLCDLCSRRKKVVLLRGSVPAPVLFVGEAPGASEDVLGHPFVGPAGNLLDIIIEEAGLVSGQYALTNIIACIPKDEDGEKAGQPQKWAIEACSDRLIECVLLVRPDLIVWVGECAAKHGPKVLGNVPCEYLHIIHPAAIIRMNISQQGLAVQRCVIALADTVQELED